MTMTETFQTAGLTGPVWSYRPATSGDEVFILKQWNRYFTDLEEADVVARGCDADDEYNLCVVAETDTRRVGCGIASVGPAAHIHGCIRVGEFPPLDDGLYGFLHLGAVLPEFRGRGIATTLMARRVAWAADAGADQVYGMSWVREAAPDSRPVFERCGFDRVATLHDYYNEYDARDHCPDCTGACGCDAVLYRKEVSGNV